MNLGSRIAVHRKKAGLSQEALAAQLGVSRQAVSRWENGEASPDIEKLRMLCAALSVSADVLLFGAEAPRSPEPPSAGSGVERAKARFRITVSTAVLVLGALLTAFALVSSLIETYRPYQEWYTDLGPYATYLFTTRRCGVLVAGLACAASGAALLYREYKRL